MVLAKDPRQSSLLYIDAFDCRLRVTRKFLLSQLLHKKYYVSVYQRRVCVCIF